MSSNVAQTNSKVGHANDPRYLITIGRVTTTELYRNMTYIQYLFPDIPCASDLKLNAISLHQNKILIP